MGDEEELLELGRHQVSRRVRMTGWAVAGLALVAAVVAREWPRTSHHAAPSAAPSGSASSPSSVPPNAAQPWPEAAGLCEGTTELPLVSSAPVTERTAMTLVLGGVGVAAVDFDTGRVAQLPRTGLRHGELVTDIAAASSTFALVSGCTIDPPPASRLVELTADGRAISRRLPEAVGSLVVDNGRLWGIGFPTDKHPFGFAVALDHPRTVPLPEGFWPATVTGGMVVGNLVGATDGPGELAVVDPATGRIRAKFGAGQLVAARNGLLLWTVGCQIDTPSPCMLHRSSVSGRSRASYRLPRPPGFSFGALSGDGRLLAFTLERAGQDPRYQQGHPIPPTDVAVLHLDTGAIDVVPGVELPAKVSPALEFSADGRWLVMALAAGPKTRLLAWHAGLDRPVETTPGPAAVPGSLALAVR